MPESYDLSRLDPNSFEHLVNLLALRVLGVGHTGFGPGSDGGRDGYFEGEAPYPSQTERWSGRWYVQSKFHKPHLTKDAQKWLIEQIAEEVKLFTEPSKRHWPDNWIIATNIDPSGAPETGSFDRAMKLVTEARPQLAGHFHIWGGSKILDLLTLYSEVARHYQHFLTPGHILSAIYEQVKDARAEVETILRFLIVKQLGDQQYTRLEQAGSDADTRPGIHRLFIDLPFRANEYDIEGLVTKYLVKAAARTHRIDPSQPDTKEWRLWHRHPSRARVRFIRGGPGQGKSTVSQYFCQIQRAALVLQEEGFPLLPSQRTLALEIKDAAETNDFWPTVPRIPVSVELKEYAQWFGQQSSEKPRGILSYLAERISIGVEQVVYVGTLKRILRDQSWFFAFDGLDEVPHDVKGQIAVEVLNFLDNVVMETNADVIALCTSRPQGYAGQFSQIDGPTIDLTSLSADQALTCAKPVLGLGRSQEEAEKSLQVLTSAIQSGSVRELMTTPLQSHIMAVVVRDGGRPPDRRWQLFTNFYDVIRRREANRNLPDRRLAKLLREDEQLLRTVHNRLGFILHARAETSKGAQTHLDRQEFKGLVTEAVSEMIETGIDETVSVLMEATTDRLVLVSTPDDGDHVRFDIRPLQEFFAAEFFYESVDAEEVRKRMEIAVGDSHWHEVMHFLLSALIERDRRTELSVAISVLEELDEGDGEYPIRLLNRRLGRGAILASRLLQEGVLEQDKRVRQQFRRCLEPATAFTDLGCLNSFLLTNQSNSQSWLIGFLVTSLLEDNYTESVGAAIALATILPDNSDRVEDVKNFLLASPPEFISEILKIKEPNRYSRFLFEPAETPLATWFTDLVLELLLRPNWTALGEGIGAALSILRTARDKTYALARNKDLSDTEIDLLRELLEGEKPNEPESEILDYGLIKISPFDSDWTTSKLSFPSWENGLPDDASAAAGILQVMFRAIKFAMSHNTADLLSLLKLLASNVETLTLLPRRIAAHIPIPQYASSSEQICSLKGLNEEKLQAVIDTRVQNSYPIHRPHRIIRFSMECSLEQWEKLCEDAPFIACTLWSPSFWEEIGLTTRPSFLDEEAGVRVLIDSVLKSPDMLRQFVALWGNLLEVASDHAADLRSAFLLASKGPVVVDQSRRVSRFSSFTLDLPNDAPMLPHLVNVLTDPSYARDNSPLIDLGKVIKKLVNDISFLEQLVEASDGRKDTRAAALIMCMLHQDGSSRLRARELMLADFYDKTISYWYVRAVTNVLRLLAPEENQIDRITAGKLLEATRTDYEGRRQMNRLLSLWRETSRAPVHKTNLQWLSGNLEI